MLRSLQVTVAACAGGIIWVFFPNPNSFIVVLTPAFIVLVAFFYSTWKEKVLNMVLAALFIAFFQFVVALLFYDKILLIFFIFFASLLIYSSVKYRNVVCVTMPIAIVSVAWLPGLDAGAFRALQLLYAFVISIAVVTSFSILTDKFQVRANLIYISSLIIDSFVIYTEDDGKDDERNSAVSQYFKLMNKLLVNRIDVKLEDIFEIKSYKFQHRISIALGKAEKFIFHDKRIINSHVKFSKLASYLIISYRDMFRSFDFISDYKKYKEKIRNFILEEEFMVLEIKHSLLIINACVAGRAVMIPNELEHMRKLKLQLDEAVKKSMNENSKVSETLYGFSLLINELLKMEKVIAAKPSRRLLCYRF